MVLVLGLWEFDDQTISTVCQVQRPKTKDQRPIMYAPLSNYIPQATTDRRPLLMWAVVACGALVLVGMVLAAPLAYGNQHYFLGGILYQAFSHICHQQPERSFFIAGQQFAVCARCTGLYAGFAGAMLCYPLLISLKDTSTPEPKWLFLAALPLAIDFGLGFFRIWENTHSSRFLTGGVLGSVAVFYLMPPLAELSLRLGSRSGSKSSNFQVAGSATSPEQIAAAPSDYSAPARRI